MARVNAIRPGIIATLWRNLNWFSGLAKDIGADCRVSRQRMASPDEVAMARTLGSLSAASC
ncbi:MAG: hypothetical protein WCD24_07430 [Serratia inhibens]|uniref:hypothetical protein n=1 Tax=Serratia inhibens TaxID=2338073 RepID=UPI003C7D386D